MTTSSSFDPFRDLDRWLTNGPVRTPAAVGMPLDLYRQGEQFVARIDLPGVDPSTVDVGVEDRTLTIRAERPAHNGDVEWLAHERPSGTFARQLTLGYGVVYTCRLALGVVKKPLIDEGVFTPVELGMIGSALYYAYAKRELEAAGWV